MAKFSKGHYKLLAGALSLQFHNCVKCGEGPRHTFHVPVEECRGCANPNEHHAFEAANTTASVLVADTLGLDNPAFNREHFLAVIRGERDVNSQPPRR